MNDAVASPAAPTTFTPVARPPAPSRFSNALVFGWRAVLKFKHVPEQLFDLVMTPIMFTLLFTFVFGGALAGSPGSYLQIFLPGILVQTVVFTTVYTGVTLNTDISKGVYDRFRSMPIWRPAPLVGALIGDAARYTIGSTVVILLGLILGFRPEGGPLGVVAAVLLLLVFSFGMGWIFTLLGLVMRAPNAVMSVGMMVLFPLTFASNIFVSPDTMPSWLQTVVDHNPITRMVTATRGLMGGDVSSGDIAWVLLAAAVLTLVFAPITMRRYRTIA
jgi:ABC-2 type transport system permease protein